MNSIHKITAQKIRNLKNTLPNSVLEKHLELQPKLKEQYDDRLKQFYLDDTRYHLSYLAESIAAVEPVLFTEYMSWAKTFFSTLPIDEDDLIQNFELIRDTLGIYLNAEESQISTSLLDEGIKKFKSQIPSPPSFILESNPLNDVANNYLNYLIDVDKKSAHDIIMNTFQDGASIKDIYLNVFQVTQKETGRLWQLGIITVAQEHFITAATQLIMSQLYPYLFSSAKKKKTIIVSCINGELHELGARMVADLFEMEGWNTYYFGSNTPQRSLINSIEVYNPDILAISSTMTFNLNSVSELVERVKTNPKTKNTKILVGGYPFILADNLWQNIGADGFASNAESAIEIASTFLN